MNSFDNELLIIKPYKDLSPAFTQDRTHSQPLNNHSVPNTQAMYYHSPTRHLLRHFCSYATCVVAPFTQSRHLCSYAT